MKNYDENYLVELKRMTGIVIARYVRLTRFVTTFSVLLYGYHRLT